MPSLSMKPEIILNGKEFSQIICLLIVGRVLAIIPMGKISYSGVAPGFEH